MLLKINIVRSKTAVDSRLPSSVLHQANRCCAACHLWFSIGGMICTVLAGSTAERTRPTCLCTDRTPAPGQRPHRPGRCDLRLPCGCGGRRRTRAAHAPRCYVAAAIATSCTGSHTARDLCWCGCAPSWLRCWLVDTRRRIARHLPPRANNRHRYKFACQCFPPVSRP